MKYLGTIYLISYDFGDFPVKVGYAWRLNDRLREILCYSPTEIVVFGTVEGSVKQEREIHRLLSDYHLRGEWFSRQVVENMLNGLIDITSLTIDYEALSASLRGGAWTFPPVPENATLASQRLSTASAGRVVGGSGTGERKVKSLTNARECINCGKEISAEKRSDAKFCSEKCRYDAWIVANH